MTTNTDPKNCGARGKQCPATTGETATCTAGVCGTKCSTGFTTCNGKCIDLNSDRNNCGTCGKTCPADSANTKYTCSSGKCYDQCSGGYLRCSPYALNGTSSTCCPPTSMCCMSGTQYGPAYAYCGSATSCY